MLHPDTKQRSDKKQRNHIQSRGGSGHNGKEWQEYGTSQQDETSYHPHHVFRR